MLASKGAETPALIRLPRRPTAVKTRYIGLAQHRHAQQMVRVDEETCEPLSEDIQRTLRFSVRSQVREADILALEDYDKGVLDERLTPQLIADARQAGRPVVVDPALISDYHRYHGATLLTPNRYEAATASGVAIVDDATLEAAARRLLEVADAEAVVITLDREGAYLCTRDGAGERFPHSRPREVYDVSGAGDEVLAAVAVALAEGCSYPQAVMLANVAGGLEVERHGIVPITRQEVLDELHHMAGLRGGKVLTRQQLAKEIRRRQRRNDIIVFTNGCFDLLHMGHVRFLRQARHLGSCLVVAINSDDGVRRLKGPNRPVIGQDERAEMLCALEFVDYVTIFQEDTAAELVKLLRPDVVAKGGSTPVVVEREVAEDCGARVVTLDLVEGLSTTDIIDRVLRSHDKQ